MTDTADRAAELPRYSAWRHLCEHAQWPDGCPAWAKDHCGQMNDSVAMRAVVEELYGRVQELDDLNTQLCEQADAAANAYRELEKLHDHALLVADAAKDRIAELEAEKQTCGTGAMCCYRAAQLEDAHGRIAELESLLPASLIPGSKDWQAGDAAERVRFLLVTRASDKQYIAELEAQLAEASAGAAGSVVDEPHPPTRHCMCAECAPSFDDEVSPPLQPARKPLTPAEIATGHRNAGFSKYLDTFTAGVEFAESLHGITGERS